MLASKLSIEKHDQGVARDAWLVLNLAHICGELMFKRLLLKLVTGSTYNILSQFYKETYGCTMGGPLSVTTPTFMSLNWKKIK